ncbi:MAG TPA: amidohydrolase family protein [Aggregatilineales bacterium]|nr:amidohydrolase family protein [Aggregatilineales bacterium]
MDTILSGGYVLTMNEGYDSYTNGAVAIRDGVIVAVGPAEEIQRHYTAADLVLCEDQVIMPGLVNSHTHAAMTLLRGLADDLRLDVWLMGYMMPTEAHFVTPEFCRLGTLLACAEMIRSGITMFADMYYFESHVAAATAEAGLRGVLGQSVLKFPTPDAPSYEDGIAATRRFIEEWKGHPLIVPAIAPHAPYTCTDDILLACAEVARDYDVPLLIHISETKLEVEDSREEFGMPVVPRVKKLGLVDVKMLAAHCVHIDSGEIRTLAKHNVGVAHCPTSNLKLASGIAPVVEMLERAMNVGIGTDGPASNNDLDMFEEVRLAAILAKGATLNPVVVPAKQALAMATRLGAQAMHMGDMTGSLEVGKRADVITVRRATLHNTPTFSRDPDAVYSQIVYAGKSTDVQHVMVNGKWLMQDQRVLTVDEAAVMREARDLALQIDAFLVAREGNVLNKLIAIGGVEQTESFEIQVKAHLPEAEDAEALFAALFEETTVQIVRQTHYRQYDTYFMFLDATQGRVRYREDDALDKDGNVESVRTRLTYTTPSKEVEFEQDVLLSRSRFIAAANRPLRFYREYFRPNEERAIQKERRRWHILYKGVLFYVNADKMIAPEMAGLFVEIKSQTWSRSDADYKAKLISELLAMLNLTPEKRIRKEYVELALI